MASGIGAALEAAPEPAHAFWFGEDQGRYVVAVREAAPLLAAAESAGVPARWLGRSGGGALVWPGGSSISVAALRDAHESALPRLMSGE